MSKHALFFTSAKYFKLIGTGEILIFYSLGYAYLHLSLRTHLWWVKQSQFPAVEKASTIYDLLILKKTNVLIGILEKLGLIDFIQLRLLTQRACSAIIVFHTIRNDNVKLEIVDWVECNETQQK